VQQLQFLQQHVWRKIHRNSPQFTAKMSCSQNHSFRPRDSRQIGSVTVALTGDGVLVWCADEFYELCILSPALCVAKSQF
jgi:hypothetical protein